MIYYFTSNTYQQVISRAVKETDQILLGSICSQDIFLLKYVKEHIVELENAERILIDLSALKDMDDEIIQALDMLRIMNYEARIIILASNRREGDSLLTKCFQMSIYDIIDSDDFLEIQEELIHCIDRGKQYKDAVRFKESQLEKVIIKNEIKQAVNKVMVGIAGSERRIGVTHNSVVLANYLRKRGFMAAIVELNDTGALEKIRNSFGEKLIDDSYFSIGGVDFYPDADTDRLGIILGKSYNFILVDFGDYNSCDKVTFHKANTNIIIAGAKPWEVDNVNGVFELCPSKDTLMQYHFCFNFTQENNREDIKDGMGELKKIYFLEYHADPFNSYEFSDAEKILEEYMPIIIKDEKEKRGLFKSRRNKGQMYEKA